MAPPALRSKHTIHNAALNNMYESQQPDHPSANDDSRSPVSPLDSSSETRQYPPCANAHPKALGSLHDIPLDEAPKNHVQSRPMSYYDGLPTSPEPDTKAVFADLPPAPPQNRLSRPFEQPHPVDENARTAQHGQAPAAPAAIPTPANMTRADSHLHRQRARSSSRKGPPAPLIIPPPAHRSRCHREPSPHPRNQTSAERSVGHQGNWARVQRPARHEGWDPLDERQQRTGHAHDKDRGRDHRRRDDLEWQGGKIGKKNRSKHDDPEYESGRRCFFSLMLMMIVAVVIIVITVHKTVHQG